MLSTDTWISDSGGLYCQGFIVLFTFQSMLVKNLIKFSSCVTPIVKNGTLMIPAERSNSFFSRDVSVPSDTPREAWSPEGVGKERSEIA